MDHERAGLDACWLVVRMQARLHRDPQFLLVACGAGREINPELLSLACSAASQSAGGEGETETGLAGKGGEPVAHDDLGVAQGLRPYSPWPVRRRSAPEHCGETPSNSVPIVTDTAA